MNNKKLFVGGYFDDRSFAGEEFKNKTKFNKHIDTYTFEELVNYIYVGDVVEVYDLEGIDWNSLSDEEKMKYIMEDVTNDDEYLFFYFETEEEAESYKNKVLEELEALSKEAVFVGIGKNDKGNNVEIYVSRKNAIYTGNERINAYGEKEDVYLLTNDFYEFLYGK